MNCGASARAVGELADIAGAVDDDEMAARIDKTGVAGLQPAFLGQRLVGSSPAACNSPGTPPPERTSTSPVSSMRSSARRQHAPDGIGVDFAIGLHRAQSRQLGSAVDLLQIDPDGAEEAERVGAERRAAGIDEPCAPQPELVAQRAVDEDLADCAQQPGAGRHRPALGGTAWARSATPRKKLKTRRFSGVASFAMTSTRVSAFSHNRGGASATVGPSSRSVALAVSRAFPESCIVKPTDRCSASASSELPIHAIGR